ncbi:MAG TPA: hypothetical protein VHR88_00010 [Solirubrobacteraceae bacterium]|nr:hypothetical protein [Solirubrobacteraceae bacterium]
MPVFDLRLRSYQARPGDTLYGWVGVVQGGATRGLTAELRYVEETRSYEEANAIVSTGPFYVGPLQPGQAFEFAVQVPPDAKPAQTGNHGRLYWMLDLKSDQPGLDAHARVGVEVLAP